MSDRLYFPRYPIFVPTKGRHEWPLTIKFLQHDEVPFRAVVVASEAEQYAKIVPEKDLLVLPSTVTNLLETRNWIRDVAEQEGHARHWQLDDNMRYVLRLYGGKRIVCDSGPAFRAIEDLVDRYSNVGVAGMNYRVFGLPNQPPYTVNTHVYSCTLVNHAMPQRWRLVYNDDTDLCLQALSNDWCTVLCNVFLVEKMPTMTVKGGNTDVLYNIGRGSELKGPYAGDGRREMARTLVKAWPHVVSIDRRFNRPQHVIDWRSFKQPLARKGDLVVFDPDEYGLELRAVSEVKSERIRQLLASYRKEPENGTQQSRVLAPTRSSSGS